MRDLVQTWHFLHFPGNVQKVPRKVGFVQKDHWRTNTGLSVRCASRPTRSMNRRPSRPHQSLAQTWKKGRRCPGQFLFFPKRPNTKVYKRPVVWLKDNKHMMNISFCHRYLFEKTSQFVIFCQTREKHICHLRRTLHVELHEAWQKWQRQEHQYSTYSIGTRSY